MADQASRWAPLAWLGALATLTAVVVLTLVRPPGPLDQADPAHQRDGLLLDGPRVDEQVAGISFGGRTVVLLFVREPPAAADLARWAGEVPDDADVRVVLPRPPASPGLRAAVDPQGRLADAVDLPRPRDGGPPVGYAVVDADRLVRYATLDPEYLTNAFEVATMAGAVS